MGGHEGFEKVNTPEQNLFIKAGVHNVKAGKEKGWVFSMWKLWHKEIFKYFCIQEEKDNRKNKEK